MAITLSTGATLSVSKTYAAPLSFTVISNAANAVCTVVGSTIVAGDYVEVSSGWGLLDKRLVRAYTGSSATSLILEGVDTSNTSKYPIGTGIGSVRKVTAWSQLSQVKGVTATGGTQNFADITAIDDVVERQIPTTKTAVSMIRCSRPSSRPWRSAATSSSVARPCAFTPPGSPSPSSLRAAIRLA